MLKIVGHAMFTAIVSDDDGDEIVEVAKDGILDWLASLNLQYGDELVIIRGRNADDE